MFNNKNVLALFTLTFLSACSITQPQAPVYNGLSYDKESAVKRPEVKPIQNMRPQFKEVEKVVEKKTKVYHTVKKGDYVWALGRQYNVKPFDIIKQNKLKRPYTLNSGDKLYIKTKIEKVKVKEKVRIEPETLAQKQPYSLTRNRALYNQNTKEFRTQPSLARQDFSKPDTDKNIDFGYHKVKRGENLFRIGRKYDVSVFDLMAYNDLSKPEDLQAGMELKIPVAITEKPAQVEQPGKKQDVKSADAILKFDKIDKDLARKKGFIYPVKGRIISKFGKQGHGIRNDGIDIAVALNTPVRASQSGTVMYAQDVSTLGKMVLLKHRSGYISAYTHNNKLLVKKGQKVAKGQSIALSGDSGNAKQPMLHFEIRRYGKAINPTRLLK
jgi:murein DD-endopeptidase MepM/ murein hydrolase activator NlpD|tara:strand:+ start:523 stop:1671 length:1149 start_codon:yes stop_codon:yes gene_type:complete